MADFALLGHSNPLERFSSICKSVYIVFSVDCSPESACSYPFYAFFSTFHSFQNAKTVPVCNQYAYIFTFCRFLPYWHILAHWHLLPYYIPYSSIFSPSESLSNECFSRRSIPYIRLTAATIKSAIERPFASAYSFSKRLFPFGTTIFISSYFSLLNCLSYSFLLNSDTFSPLLNFLIIFVECNLSIMYSSQ